MFDVRFFQFSKRYNSTKRPDLTSGTVYHCKVLDGTAIINPKIVLDIGLTANPSRFNYAYIPGFNRYYHIREWSFDRGLWIANMTVDVLATYRESIGGSYLYVLRASNSYDGSIIDNKYPTKTGCTFNKTVLTDPFQHAGNGCYVVGVIGKRGMYGSITYYVLNRAGLAVLCNYLISDAVTVANNFSENDATLALQNSIVDPLQYIKSVTWLPFSASDLPLSPQQPSNLNVFQWDVPNTNADLLFGATMVKNYTFNVIKHPDTSARGNYVNCSPYTLATLSFPPFGNIEIDTTVLCNASTLNVELRIDCLTGKGIITISANNTILNRIEAGIGVPIQIAQITSDYVGAITNIAGAVPKVIGGFAMGGAAGVAGGIAGAISGIGNAIESLAPRSQTIGSSGGFAHLRGNFELDFQFFRPVADDLAQNGRPLCQKRYPKDLKGYMLIQDGDVSTAGTQAENEQIQALLEGGFYYE